MRFRAVPILGDSRIDIVIDGFPGTVAREVHGTIGRELVKLANERLEQLDRPSHQPGAPDVKE